MWVGTIPAPYNPRFNDGWQHPAFNMDDLSMSLPPGNAASYGQPMNNVNSGYGGGYGQNQNGASLGNPYGQPTRPSPGPVQGYQQGPSQGYQQGPSQPGVMQPPPVQAAAPAMPQGPPAQGQNQGIVLPANLVSPDPSQRGYLADLKAKGARIYIVSVGREGKNPKELTVKAGDVVEIIDNSRNWWKVKNHAEAAGFVPNTILAQYTD